MYAERGWEVTVVCLSFGERGESAKLWRQPGMTMEKVKANSSGWVKDRWPDHRSFGWQTGYAAFSVSRSHVDQVKRYIGNQVEHHRKVSFQEELVAFLDKQGIKYDPRYVFV